MASGSKKAIIAALIGNSLISVTKFFAAVMTGSSAMFSEGVHSAVDTGNQVLLLHGLKKGAIPPSERFPFGRGKEIYFYSFVVAILIFGLGAGISIYEGVQHILHPEHADNPMVNYLVLGLSIIFEGGSWYVALREFQKVKGDHGYLRAVARSKNPSIFVVLFEDSAAMLGLFAALAGVFLADYTGNPIWDGAASIVIGVILAGTAVWLAYETHGLLIGEGAQPEVVAAIRTMALERPEIVTVGELATLHMGPEYIVVTMSADFQDSIPASAVEKAVSELDCEIKKMFPLVQRVFIEAQARCAL